MKPSPPRQSLNPALPKDVHDALSYILKAYSIFTPSPQLPLFQAVLVNPDRDHRHKSPQATPLNLENIVYDARNIPGLKPGSECQHVIDLLEKEISERLQPPSTEPMCSDLENVEQEVSVSVSSLIRAEVTAMIPEMGVAFGGRFSREKRRAAKLKLTSQRSRRYSGSYLGIFLWEQGEFLFRRMLWYLHGDLGIEVGDRRLLAFVTKHITGTVSVSTTEFRDTNAGLAGPSILGGCFRSTNENEANCNNMGGVIGVHFIVFPVEKSGDNKWRFFRPIEVVDEENTGSDSSRRFQTASRWAIGEKGVHLHNSTESKDVCNDDLETTDDSESSHSDTTESSAAFHEGISAEEYQDISFSDTRRPWIDVDLGESVQDLARRQVKIARHYRSLKDEGNSNLISHLLRRAADLGNGEADYELLAYREEREITSNERTILEMGAAEDSLTVHRKEDDNAGVICKRALDWTMPTTPNVMSRLSSESLARTSVVGRSTLLMDVVDYFRSWGEALKEDRGTSGILLESSKTIPVGPEGNVTEIRRKPTAGRLARITSVRLLSWFLIIASSLPPLLLILSTFEPSWDHAFVICWVPVLPFAWKLWFGRLSMSGLIKSVMVNLLSWGMLIAVLVAPNHSDEEAALVCASMLSWYHLHRSGETVWFAGHLAMILALSCLLGLAMGLKNGWGITFCIIYVIGVGVCNGYLLLRWVYRRVLEPRRTEVDDRQSSLPLS